MNMHEAMIQDIDREIERLTIVRAYHASRLGDSVRGTVAHTTPTPRPVRKLAPRVAAPQQDAELATPRHELAELLLRESGRPMTTGELLAASREKGLDADSDDRGVQNGFYTAMSRHSETFIKVDRGLWGLVGRDEPVG